MEGNQQKMREELLALSAWVKIVKDHPKDKTATECAEFIEQAVNAALSAPPRNCDVGTAEEQERRFRKYCETEECNRYRCGHGCKAVCIDRCAVLWSQMPYEAQEGGAAQ